MIADGVKGDVAMARSFSRFGFTVLGLSILACVSIETAAEEWPTHSVRIVVPYGPGGISDVLGRPTADRLSKHLGQPFIIENRAGGGGSIGTEFVARSPKDGYTLLFAGGAQFSVIPLTQKLNYDPLKELAPVSIVGVNGMALAVNPELPVRSLREFIDYARANPGKLNYGVGGLGTSSHLTPAAFAAREGLQMVAIPYQATPPMVAAVIAGTAQVFFGNVSDIMGAVDSGHLRLLAVSSAKRIPQYPDVPTVAETLPGFVMTGWNGYFAPAGTPQPIIDRLSQALTAICREPEIGGMMAKLGIQSVGNTPSEVAEIIRAELPVYEAAVRAAGLYRNERQP